MQLESKGSAGTSSPRCFACSTETLTKRCALDSAVVLMPDCVVVPLLRLHYRHCYLALCSGTVLSGTELAYELAYCATRVLCDVR
eukprot:1893632-Rhodomonas_salina.1